jgi:hypothetical protein
MLCQKKKRPQHVVLKGGEIKNYRPSVVARYFLQFMLLYLHKPLQNKDLRRAIAPFRLFSPKRRTGGNRVELPEWQTFFGKICKLFCIADIVTFIPLDDTS